jgi:NTP pyrophosphatase (non-canonical NTP hydrolase)
MRVTINELVERAHANAKEKGFWDGENHNIGEKLALIHSEVSEALEEVRHINRLPLLHYMEGSDKPEGFGIELADVIIRVADLCGHFGIDLNTCIQAKVTYNATRPRKHGKAF